MKGCVRNSFKRKGFAAGVRASSRKNAGECGLFFIRRKRLQAIVRWCLRERRCLARREVEAWRERVRKSIRVCGRRLHDLQKRWIKLMLQEADSVD